MLKMANLVKAYIKNDQIDRFGKTNLSIYEAMPNPQLTSSKPISLIIESPVEQF